MCWHTPESVRELSTTQPDEQGQISGIDIVSSDTSEGYDMEVPDVSIRLRHGLSRIGKASRSPSGSRRDSHESVPAEGKCLHGQASVDGVSAV